ncbi:Copia protein [Cyphomyrmex costatus]|uniref:Copia protein n=1 Tax=Cyphomyrmex costatus TaxID=456900 RepID=A0A151IN10_9HYME|nr:Copia protein [Cyphomyrmex costatus]
MCDIIKLSIKDLEELKNICEICQQAKQSRLKFGNGRIKAERPFQIIHTNLCETHWNLKVSKIRCDNGKEYVNKDVQVWCKTRGIIMDTTTPYTLQLNGKAEKLNKTLLDKVRALLFDSTLDKEMWGEAFYCATYILNRLPINTLEKTPYEMWEKRKPNLESMQIFGSIAHAKNLGPQKKVDERSSKLLFVGYALNGYRLWSQEKCSN